MEGESSRSNSFYRGSSSKNLARAVPDNGVDDELTLGGSSGSQRNVRRRILSENGTGMSPHATNIGFSGFAGPNIFSTLAASSRQQNNYFPRQFGVSSNECRNPCCHCQIHSASSSTMPMPQMALLNVGYAILQPRYVSAIECVNPPCSVHSVPSTTLPGCGNPQCRPHSVTPATMPEMAFPWDGYEIPPVSEVNEVHAGSEEQNVNDDSDEDDDDDADEEDDELYEDDDDADEKDEELYEEDDDVDDEHNNVLEAHSDDEEDDELDEEDDDEDEDNDGEEDDELYGDEGDVRLDIDNMSYEEILALEEHNGNHDVGLDVPTINAHLRCEKYLSLRQPPGNGTCSICLEDYVDAASLGKLNCNHDFHFDCLKQ